MTECKFEWIDWLWAYELIGLLTKICYVEKIIVKKLEPKVNGYRDIDVMLDPKSMWSVLKDN